MDAAATGYDVSRVGKRSKLSRLNVVAPVEKILNFSQPYAIQVND